MQTQDNEEQLNISETQVLSDALDMYERNVSVEEIVRMYHEYEQQIRAMLETTQMIERVKDGRMMSEETARRMLYAITQNQKNAFPAREIWETVVRRIFSFIRTGVSMSWKIAVPAVVAIAILGGGLMIKSRLAVAPSDVGMEQMRLSFAPATGNVDDAISAFVQAAAQEQAVVALGDQDISLTVADSQSINNFSQIYNEMDF